MDSTPWARLATAGGLRRVVVLLREDQYQALRRRAYEQECSVSELVRAAVDEHFEDGE